MCTVSYMPVPGGFVLTSNRDEDPGRETAPPQALQLPGGNKVFAPRDLEKGGTWIALQENGRMGCLLNGAFGRHNRTPPYRKSRGHLIFEALDAPGFEEFIVMSDLDDIEPFTLLLIEPDSILKLLWDGRRKYHWQLPSGSLHLWSSPTLYTPVQHAEKEAYFRSALRQAGTSAEELLLVHGRDYDTPFILDRPEVRTVSITQVVYNGQRGEFKYHQKVPNNEKASLVSTATF